MSKHSKNQFLPWPENVHVWLVKFCPFSLSSSAFSFVKYMKTMAVNIYFICFVLKLPFWCRVISFAIRNLDLSFKPLLWGEARFKVLSIILNRRSFIVYLVPSNTYRCSRTSRLPIQRIKNIMIIF